MNLMDAKTSINSSKGTIDFMTESVVTTPLKLSDKLMNIVALKIQVGINDPTTTSSSASIFTQQRKVVMSRPFFHKF